MSHRCVRKITKEYTADIRKKSDYDLARIMRMDEYKKPLAEQNWLWRIYGRICRQEAHKRGLGT